MEPLILYPSKPKTFLLLFGSGLFTIVGVWMAHQTIAGWIVSIFFGICSIVLIASMLPNASYLRVTKKGFEVCSLFTRSFTHWKDVAGFRSKYIGPMKMVVFNYVPDYMKFKAGRGLAKTLTGIEGVLPDTYGKSAEELAKLLNEWKEKAPKDIPDDSTDLRI